MAMSFLLFKSRYALFSDAETDRIGSPFSPRLWDDSAIQIALLRDMV